MSEKTRQCIRLLYRIVSSVLIVAAGGALILSCFSIYNSPEGTFSRETVAAAFGRISVVVYAAVAVILVGAVASFVLPPVDKRVKPIRSEASGLARLRAGYDLSHVTPETQAALTRERDLRRLFCGITAGVCVLCLAPCLVWVLRPDSFGAGEDKTQEIMIASGIILGCFAVAVITAFVLDRLVQASLRRERGLILSAVTDRTAVRVDKSAQASRRLALWERPTVLWSVRGVVLFVAVLFVVLGVCNGGMHDVLGKAVRICTECIGLG